VGRADWCRLTDRWRLRLVSCVALLSHGMSPAIEQAKWAVILRMRGHSPGDVPSEDDRQVRWSELDLYLATRGFAGDVMFGGPDVRRQAVEALGWLGDQRGISPLLRGLTDEDVVVRWEAAAGLAQFDTLPEWSIDSLARALGDEDPGVRDSAATALGLCGCQAAVTAVAEALDDSVATVRASAAHALCQLGRHGYLSDEVLAGLSELLDDTERGCLCRVLGVARPGRLGV